ncbi:hypothetical protein GQ457_13G011930 [Hibiscus cannabinus]
MPIWDDKWIPNLPSRPMSSTQPPFCRDFLVSRLIIDDTREWNRDKVNRLFSPSEIEAILSIPIGGLMVKDVLV